MTQRNIIYLKNGFVWKSCVKILDDVLGYIIECGASYLMS